MTIAMSGTMVVVWVLTDEDEREMMYTNAQRAHHVQLIHHSILKVSNIPYLIVLIRCVYIKKKGT